MVYIFLQMLTTEGKKLICQVQEKRLTLLDHPHIIQFSDIASLHVGGNKLSNNAHPHTDICYFPRYNFFLPCFLQSVCPESSTSAPLLETNQSVGKCVQLALSYYLLPIKIAHVTFLGIPLKEEQSVWVHPHKITANKYSSR